MVRPLLSVVRRAVSLSRVFNCNSRRGCLPAALAAAAPLVVSAALAQTVSVDNSVTKAPQTVSFGAMEAGQGSVEKDVSFTFKHFLTLGKIDVLTMGARNLEFKDAGTGTCEVNRTYSAGETCTVHVSVTPQFPGQHVGAVVLTDDAGQAIESQSLFDSVSGAQLIFPPGTDSAISANQYPSTSPTSPAVNLPPSTSNPFSAWDQPEGIAVDGSGNVWVADSQLDNLYKIPYSGGSYSPPVLIDGHALGNPFGVGVDWSGNV